jgi:hypothetical protein
MQHEQGSSTRLSISFHFTVFNLIVNIVSGAKIIFSFLAYFPYFEKKSRLMRSRCLVCECLCIPPTVAWQRLGKIPLSLLGNGSEKIPLSLLASGLVETLPR